MVSIPRRCHPPRRIFLRDKLSAWLKANTAKYGESTLKYIDPSYTIRSCPASSNDAAFCVQLANCAVHEGMSHDDHDTGR